MKQKFPSGQVVATPAALEFASEHNVNLFKYLWRHLEGDWGDVSDEDKQYNDEALENGGRLLSSYKTGHGKVWIITEADRAATTILLPEDY